MRNLEWVTERLRASGHEPAVVGRVTAAVTHSVVSYDPTETSAEVKAAAGLLAGYSGRTREAYPLDLRQFYG